LNLNESDALVGVGLQMPTTRLNIIPLDPKAFAARHLRTTLDFVAPLSLYLEESTRSNLFEPESVQES
jgi:hypothetical protein